MPIPTRGVHSVLRGEPAIHFCGLQVFADRQGYRVTGHVDFPYAVSGRDACPIDYLSTGLDGWPRKRLRRILLKRHKLTRHTGLATAHRVASFAAWKFSVTDD